MLVLTLRKGKAIRIGDDIYVEILSGGKVKIGVDAPVGVKVLRTELITETPVGISIYKEQSND